jgi:GNAT superfamily N-acetyltransferase
MTDPDAMIEYADEAAPSAGRVTVRKLWPHEREAYVAHLLRLEPEAQRWRFGMTMTDAALRAYAGRSFCVGGLVHACCVDGVVRATGELQGLLDFPRQHGEAAFSVEKGWRRQGIGSRLFAAVLLSARNRGMSVLDVMCHPDNLAMKALARRHGVTLQRLYGETHGLARLDISTPSSLMVEALANTASAFGAILDAQTRYARRSSIIPSGRLRLVDKDDAKPRG